MAAASQAAALASLAEVVMVQPLDMVKTRFQLYEGGRNPSVGRALLDIYREGGVSRFYRGFLPEAASTMPARTAMYMTYNAILKKMSEHMPLTAGCSSLAGACAGIPEGMLVTPLQVVKVRLQSKEYLGRYHGTLDCCKKIVLQEGVQGLFAGLGATAARNFIWNGVYFGLIFHLKALLQSGNDSGMTRFVGTSGISFVGGAIATCFNAPLDTAKSRMQLQDTKAATPKYRNTLQTLALVVKEEGPRACYKGFAPKVLRMAFGGAVGMPIFEAVNAALTKRYYHDVMSNFSSPMLVQCN